MADSKVMSLRKKAFNNVEKPWTKLKAIVKVLGLMRSKPRVVNWPKHDPDDLKEIYLKIKGIEEKYMKGKKDFNGMETRGPKKWLEIIGNFMQGMNKDVDYK